MSNDTKVIATKVQGEFNFEICILLAVLIQYRQGLIVM